MKVLFHTQFRLNGYQFKTIDELINYSKLVGDAVSNFLIDWFDDSLYIKVHTSGSTGIPKVIQLKKEHMKNSAKATGSFFNLTENTTALLCMSPQFIAGKMMLVRALELGWDLDMVEPRSNPLKEIDKVYDFCAMVPMQVNSSLNELHKIKKLIVGGGEVSSNLIEKIQSLTTEIFATYGMTETITHIAVQKLNHFEEVILCGSEKSLFTVLPSISISKDNRSCLVIDAPNVSDKIIITNDIVEIINENSFQWLGRFDNIINSGGVKIVPEQVESKLQQVIKNRFFIASEPDELLGNKVVLIIESEAYKSGELVKLQVLFQQNLFKYEVPKNIYFTPKFLETATKKIQRLATLDLVFNQPKL